MQMLLEAAGHAPAAPARKDRLCGRLARGRRRGLGTSRGERGQRTRAASGGSQRASHERTKILHLMPQSCTVHGTKGGKHHGRESTTTTTADALTLHSSVQDIRGGRWLQYCNTQSTEFELRNIAHELVQHAQEWAG